MNINEIVKDRLERFPPFRERGARGPYLSILALRHAGLEYNHQSNIPFTTKQLSDFAISYASFERAWRQILAEPQNEKLRGKDYYDKVDLETKKMSELGYNIT